MTIQKQYRGLTLRVISSVALLVVGVAISCMPGFAAHGQTGPEPPSSAQNPNSAESHTHMSEELRSSIKRVVVIPGQSPANESVTGTYEKDTPGLVGGMDEGSRAATISKDIGGVPVYFPIPVLSNVAMILGGISGKYKQQVQEFRDALTEELAQAGSQPLTNEGLALDVFRGLRNVPNLDSKLFAPTTPIPADTDAILYVSLNELAIDVQEKDAIITTSAKATLRRLSDGRDLYERVIQYQNMDTLSNWTENENALWRDYANFARHYLGLEISAEVFDRVELAHVLQPRETDTLSLVRKNEWQGVSRSLSPTLAWELSLLGGDSYGAWASAIIESDIYYDLDIYDMHQLVYTERQVQGPRHTIAVELEACQTYRWSVRPTYRVGSDTKVGQWMRANPDTNDEIDPEMGIVGRKMSESPAYIQDFASLNIECGRR